MFELDLQEDFQQGILPFPENHIFVRLPQKAQVYRRLVEVAPPLFLVHVQLTHRDMLPTWKSKKLNAKTSASIERI